MINSQREPLISQMRADYKQQELVRPFVLQDEFRMVRVTSPK